MLYFRKHATVLKAVLSPSATSSGGVPVGPVIPPSVIPPHVGPVGPVGPVLPPRPVMPSKDAAEHGIVTPDHTDPLKPNVMPPHITPSGPVGPTKPTDNTDMGPFPTWGDLSGPSSTDYASVNPMSEVMANPSDSMNVQDEYPIYVPKNYRHGGLDASSFVIFADGVVNE